MAWALAACLTAGTFAAVAGAPLGAALAAVAAFAIYGALKSPGLLFAAWFAATPWASYWLRFPEERSIVTFDRVVVSAVVAGFAVRAWRRRRPPRLTLYEAAWLCFGLVALASAATAAEATGFALRTAVDAFLLPLALLVAVRAGFEPAEDRRPLFWGAVLLGLALPWPGVVEFVTASDVMAFAGASILRTGIVRANGPFVTDNSYALVGAMTGLFLLWLPRELGFRVEGLARAVWRAAQGGAFLAALLPIFRAVILALAAALALPALAAGRLRALSRAALAGALLLVASLPALVPLSQTATFRDRISDPSSAFSRAATYLAAIDVIGDRPILGVGLTNYHTYFEAKYGTAWYVDVEAVNDVGAESYPHNNLLGVWAELGVVGLFFYLLAAFALAAAAWRRRSVAALALMVVYWLPGMTLQSGVYSDLNLYYFAMLGVLLCDARRGAPAERVAGRAGAMVPCLGPGDAG